MKKSLFLIRFSLIGILLAVSFSGSAFSGDDEDAKLARYGQYGGPFSLIDHRGNTVTDRDFLGRYMLLFFGYTYCPDVCPTTMQEVSDTLDLLGEEGKIIEPIFISVDPERDTPESLAGFVDHFHPRMTGLTGDKEQLHALAEDYGVTYFKVFTPKPTSASDEDDKDSDEDENADYLINHSAATYLMGPDGKFIAYIPYGTSSTDMAEGIRQIFAGKIPQ